MCFLSFGIDRNSYSDEVNVTEVKSYIKSIKKSWHFGCKILILVNILQWCYEIIYYYSFLNYWFQWENNSFIFQEINQGACFTNAEIRKNTSSCLLYCLLAETQGLWTTCLSITVLFPSGSSGQCHCPRQAPLFGESMEKTTCLTDSQRVRMSWPGGLMACSIWGQSQRLVQGWRQGFESDYLAH